MTAPLTSLLKITAPSPPGHRISVQGDHGAVYECCVVVAVSCRPKEGGGGGSAGKEELQGGVGMAEAERFFIGEAVYIDVEVRRVVGLGGGREQQRPHSSGPRPRSPAPPLPDPPPRTLSRQTASTPPPPSPPPS